ncbi:MAG TPA: hypothetical protein P5293_00405 [Bacteroidales bacterium]|nr:hypothetical protein [Bacteroidales bacterium]
MDEYAKESCVDLYKGDIEKQSDCWWRFYSRLIGFAQEIWMPYMSKDLIDELVSEMEEHAKFITKKYGWYSK